MQPYKHQTTREATYQERAAKGQLIVDIGEWISSQFCRPLPYVQPHVLRGDVKGDIPRHEFDSVKVVEVGHSEGDAIQLKSWISWENKELFRGPGSLLGYQRCKKH